MWKKLNIYFEFRSNNPCSKIFDLGNYYIKENFCLRIIECLLYVGAFICNK